MKSHILFNQGRGGEEGTIVGKVTKCSLGSFQSVPRLFSERTLLPKAYKALSVLFMDE